MKWVAVVCLVLSSSLSAEDAEAVYKQGIAELRDAQNDHAALVPATKLLAQAAALYEAAGDEAKTAEVNSCLYWAKKKMTLADTQAVKTDAQVSQRIEAVAKAIPASEAKAMLEKAEAFAKGHADDPLLTAIRYFEVGDRFPETAEGRRAIQQSLAAMQKVGERAKLEAYEPAPTDGKAFIKSEPVGAAIVFVTPDGGKLDTGKVTPALVQLPVGRQSLELMLKAHKPATLSVEVDGKTIGKPDAVKIEPFTVPVDIIFEDGWSVFVDGKPAKASGTGKAETPCTVELPLGRHDLGLAKEGFMDVRQQVEVAEGGVKAGQGMPQVQVEVKARPSKGTGLLARPVSGVAAQNAASAPLFLSQLRAVDSLVGWDQLRVGQTEWGGHLVDIKINNAPSPHSLACHARTDDDAYAKYQLDGNYRMLSGGVAIDDLTPRTKGTLTFTVVGDDKMLWESQPMNTSHKVQEFAVDVRGVRLLKLVVKCKGNAAGGRAVWVEPRLLGK